MTAKEAHEIAIAYSKPTLSEQITIKTTLNHIFNSITCQANKGLFSTQVDIIADYTDRVANEIEDRLDALGYVVYKVRKDHDNINWIIHW